ncbi:hypothetical protein [Streptomyces sp. NPDC058745]|uniref:hypothetical protein n=1 Tax=Streptomyces sp. NPDC058745 TaxID=3346621 RepID=UPI003695410A
MSVLTLTPALTGDQDPSAYAGRADAYDEHMAGVTLDELLVRVGYVVEYHDTQYALGYGGRVDEIRRETRALNAAQANAAQEQSAVTA